MAKRKGMQSGRPVGPSKNLRFDPLADKIDSYLAKKIDKRSIAKLLDVLPNTLYAWLKVQRLVVLEYYRKQKLPDVLGFLGLINSRR